MDYTGNELGKIALIKTALAEAFLAKTVRSFTRDAIRAEVFAVEDGRYDDQAFVVAPWELLAHVDEDGIRERLRLAITILREGHPQVLLGEKTVEPRTCLPE
jgi:hypothetical protein